MSGAHVPKTLRRRLLEHEPEALFEKAQALASSLGPNAANDHSGDVIRFLLAREEAERARAERAEAALADLLGALDAWKLLSARAAGEEAEA